jgi:ABC-type multidrug transport system fused ATPase/permease subunit
MAFFDTTPVGRIMNRFSSDIDVIDDRFPRTFRIMSVMSCVLLGTIIVIVVTTPISVVVIIPMIILYIVAIVSILFPFFVRVMVFNATFNNIFVISRQ